MKFHYTASDAVGRILEGDVDAQSSDDVLSFIASKGLRPVSLRVSKDAQGLKPRAFFGQRITVADKIFLTKYLALMLRAGTDLFKAIDVLIKDFEKPILKALLLEIRTALEKGQSFFSTFAKYPQYFSSVFVNLVRAGEASGNLEMVFSNLSVSLGKEQELRNTIRGALIYSANLFGASLLIFLFLVSFALPKISGVFSGSGFEPPLFSRIVFAIGNFMNQYIIFIVPGLVAFAMMLWVV